MKSDSERVCGGELVTGMKSDSERVCGGDLVTGGEGESGGEWVTGSECVGPSRCLRSPPSHNRRWASKKLPHFRIVGGCHQFPESLVPTRCEIELVGGWIQLSKLKLLSLISPEIKHEIFF